MQAHPSRIKEGSLVDNLININKKYISGWPYVWIDRHGTFINTIENDFVYLYLYVYGPP